MTDTYDPKANGEGCYREAIAAKRANATCIVCGTPYYVKPYRLSKTKYCSQSCGGKDTASKHLNKGPKPWAAKNLEGHRHKSTSRFKSGQEPWNKGVKGIHLSPNSEFQKGRVSEKLLPFGTVSIRIDKQGNERAWIKCWNGQWKPRATYVYELRNGPVPDGHVIHHIDRDTLNDRVGNLACLSRSEHIAEHRHELQAAKAPEPKQEPLL